MRSQNAGNKRARAWVLAKAAEAEDVAEKLYEELGHWKGDDDFVVVRADVVAESPNLPYNIVVPVDAANEAVLSGVVDDIKKANGVSDAVVLKVLGPHPDPPHNAHGYVTKREADAGIDTEVKKRPGRQYPRSPGANPFG